jgi:hypothetical protein
VLVIHPARTAPDAPGQGRPGAAHPSSTLGRRQSLPVPQCDDLSLSVEHRAAPSMLISLGRIPRVSSLPPPAFLERCHRGLARGLVAEGRRAITATSASSPRAPRSPS